MSNQLLPFGSKPSASVRVRRRASLSSIATLVAVMFACAFTAEAQAAPLYQVNAGGPVVSTTSPVWDADTVLMPSTYSNSTGTKNKIFSTGSAIDISSPTIPAGTPASLFQTQRYDPTGGQEMQWSFPATAGQQYDVRLYFAETYTPNFVAGARTFGVAIDGATVLSNYDVYSDAGGGNKGVVKTFRITSDGVININFAHGATDNPEVSAIGIDPVAAGPLTSQLNTSVSSVPFDSVTAGQIDTRTVTLTNGGVAGAPSIVVDSTNITGANNTEFSDNFNDASHVTLAPGASTNVVVTFAPGSAGSKSASLSIVHNGSNTPLAIPLSGTGTQPAPVASSVRINAGGALVTSSPNWQTDTSAAPSTYSNFTGAKNKVLSNNATINMTDPSIPAGTPASLFNTERYDPTGGQEMQWSIPAPVGATQVRLYFAETYAGTQAVGARKFDVTIEGQLVLDDYDIFANVGANKAVAKTFNVTSDGTININFGHVTENPMVNAIEVIPGAGTVQNQLTLSSNVPSVSFGGVNVGATKNMPVVLTASGPAGSPPLHITQSTLSGSGAGQFSDQFDDTLPTTLSNGQSVTIGVNFAPTTAGAKSATLAFANDGTTPSVSIPLTGTGNAVGGSTQIGFGKSILAGASLNSPTSLMFGPDGKLYVSQFSGNIAVYGIQRNGPNSYSVTSSETVSVFKSIPNHFDDGTLDPNTKSRLVTGIWVAGTAANPVIYATSSDPRTPANGGEDTNLDTNSSMVSKATKSGTTWTRQDLVRGLPRSEENHAANGLFVDAATNTLYFGISGNTNMGGPSSSFAFLPEYAMGNGILKVNLTQIGSGTYDLPTLDDEDRPNLANGSDPGDPFGGDNGKNMAKMVPPSAPIQFFATGLRNPYDTIRASNGSIYTIDNGGNAGWGDPPVNEGPQGNCTNGLVTSTMGSVKDKLFRVTEGAYLGHPNPTRGNMNNTFNASNPQSPVTSSDPKECDFLEPEESGALATFDDSTNGFAEYTSSNFNSAMKGDFIAPLYNGNSINRIDMNAAGTAANSNTTLFSTVGQRPLDIAAMGDDSIYRGDLFVADLAVDGIVIFEPNDFDGTASTCTGADNPAIDEDNDGYTNADEIDNGTNPCSAADQPGDHDQDGVSDLNDTDDDNDGITDKSDPFAIDAQNGKQNSLPVNLLFDNGQAAGGLLGSNFTGLMQNGSTDWLTQYDRSLMAVGGAAGVFSIDAADEGDALGATNTQRYAFQVGANVPTSGTTPYTVQTNVGAPFNGVTPVDFGSMGEYIGTGDQDNYIKITTSSNGGAGGITVVREVNGVVTSTTTVPQSFTGLSSVDLYLQVVPGTGLVQPSYRTNTAGTPGARIDVGPPVALPSAWVTAADRAPAVGVISTSRGPAAPFPVKWDFIRVVSGDASTGP